MSRFLRDRHYKLAVAGVLYCYLHETEHGEDKTLKETIMTFLDESGISYTQEDVEIIETAYKQKYGK